MSEQERERGSVCAEMNILHHIHFSILSSSSMTTLMKKESLVLIRSTNGIVMPSSVSFRHYEQVPAHIYSKNRNRIKHYIYFFGQWVDENQTQTTSSFFTLRPTCPTFVRSSKKMKLNKSRLTLACFQK